MSKGNIWRPLFILILFTSSKWDFRVTDDDEAIILMNSRPLFMNHFFERFKNELNSWGLWFCKAKKWQARIGMRSPSSIYSARLWKEGITSCKISFQRMNLKNFALAGYPSWWECHPDMPRLRVRSPSRHVQESTNECINKWNKKLMFLSLTLPLSVSKKSLKIIKFFKKIHGCLSSLVEAMLSV